MDLSKSAKQLGKKGGKKSAQIRFAGKSKKEISEIMKGIRKGLRKGGIIDEDMVKNLIKYLAEAEGDEIRIKKLNKMKSEFVKGLNETAEKD